MELIYGDCMKKLKEIEDRSIDLVITDPPYGIDYQTFRTKSDNIAKERLNRIRYVGNDYYFCSYYVIFSMVDKKIVSSRKNVA